MMKVLDLFSGIGGFSLGLEMTGGFETVAFCEVAAFQQRVLARHWPETPCFPDVAKLTASDLEEKGIYVDVICGGFPCQDISEANVHGEGLDGAKSGLWREYHRLIRELRPQYVIVENVAALLVRGLNRVLGDLAALGYDAEWHGIPASAVGAPHDRDRIWIIAYPSSSQRRPILEQGHLARAHSIFRSREEDAGGPARLPQASWIHGWREVADGIFGMDDGLSKGLDGYNSFANAVVPLIPAIIGQAILEDVNSTPHDSPIGRTAPSIGALHGPADLPLEQGNAQ